jgi:hypothetical protein
VMHFDFCLVEGQKQLLNHLLFSLYQPFQTLKSKKFICLTPGRLPLANRLEKPSRPVTNLVAHFASMGGTRPPPDTDFLVFRPRHTPPNQIHLTFTRTSFEVWKKVGGLPRVRK